MLLLLAITLACTDSGKANVVDDTGPCVETDWHLDGDGDGYGAGQALAGCAAPDGHVRAGGDCDDSDVMVNPGADELCDGLDNNCDGVVDPDNASDALTCSRDADGDGWGTDDQQYLSCTCSDGYVTDATDCDDADDTIYPGAPESWYDGVDSDCAGGDDDDADADGYAWEGRGGQDCNDQDSAVSPDALDICGDGIDNDCNDAEATCGLSGTTSERGADLTVMNEYLASFGYDVAYAGDSNGDGIGEVMIARTYMGDLFDVDDPKIPQHDFVLMQLPLGLDVEDSHSTALGVSDVLLASFQVPDPRRQWDAIVWTHDEPPLVANVDFDGDGLLDYMLASVQANPDGPPTRIDLWHGPATGVIDLSYATTVETPDYLASSHPGSRKPYFPR